MNTRFLGTICIVGSIAILLDQFRWIALGLEEFDALANVAGILWAIGGICALIGMIRLNAVGSSTVVRALAFLPIIGFVLLIVGSIISLANAPAGDTLTGVAWLVQLTGMVVVGILVIAAKTWQGWRRFAPLLTIVMVPVGFGLGAAAGNDEIGAVIIFSFWVLLGYVVATAEPAPALLQSPAV